MSEEPQQQTLLPEPVKRATTQRRTIAPQALKPHVEYAIELLKGAGMKGLCIKEIADLVVKHFRLEGSAFEDVKAQVGSALLKMAWKDGKPKVGAEVRRIKIPGKTESYRKGCFRWIGKAVPPVNPTQPDVQITAYFGSAGEYAVAAEYLYKGYNVTRPTVDTGIDLIVFKNGIFQYIQVKTSSLSNGKFQFSIDPKAFANNSDGNTFYVLVCRRHMKTFYRHDFIVLPSTAIDLFIGQNLINKGKTISIGITIDAKDKVLLSGSHDITSYLNRFIP